MFHVHATSIVAKGIYSLWDFIRNNSCFIISDGNLVGIWKTLWVPWMNFDSYGATFNPLICDPNTKVSLLFGDDVTSWNGDLLRRFFLPEASTFFLNVQQLPLDRKDQLCQKNVPSISFSVKWSY